MNNFLTTVLSFDEFKATKDTTGTVAFMVVDSVNKELIDIVQIQTTRILSSLSEACS